jgi:hypothetical protein
MCGNTPVATHGMFNAGFAASFLVVPDQSK